MDTKLLLYLLVLFHTGDSGCPEVCKCTNTSVLCMENDLEKIPNLETLDNEPLIIDLSGNKIGMIGPDDFSFDKTDEVKEVYLNNSQLFDIDYEAFDEMENLQELYLGENLLNSIPDNLVEELQDLILLDLSNNYFSGKMPVIKSQSLEVLVLANCKITSIGPEALKHLPNLRILLLQQNNINFIDPRVFDSVPHMFFIRLSYNSWECNCRTMELFDFLAKKKFVDTSEPYKCSQTGGQVVDIYGPQGIEVYRNTCVRRGHSEKVGSQRKKYKYLTKQEYQLLEKDSSLRSSRKDIEDLPADIVYNKSYSLVRENEQSKRDSSGEFIAPVEDTKNDSASGVKLTENTIEIRGCESPKYLIPGLGISLNVFLFIISSFLIGLVVGFSLNQCVNSARYKRLDTSDSTTRLKVDFH